MSQLDFIKSHLEKYGYISRNICLRNYISRLGARIADLKKLGYDFDTKTVEGDYFYYLKGWQQPRTEVYVLKDGDRVVDTIRKEITMKM